MTHECGETAALFKEYDTLRQESLQSMSNRNQIIAFGLGTLGILVSGTLAAPSPRPDFIRLVFSVGLPVVSVLIYYVWFAEVERMVRAGRVLQRLEQRLNRLLEGPPVLTWEREVERARMWYPYITVSILFLGVAVAAPYAGLWLRQSVGTNHGLLWLPSDVTVGTLLRESAVAWSVTAFSIAHVGGRFMFQFRAYRPDPESSALASRERGR